MLSEDLTVIEEEVVEEEEEEEEVVDDEDLSVRMATSALAAATIAVLAM